MKRILQSLFVGVFALLFFLIYQNFVEQDASNFHNLFGGIDRYESGGIVFNQSFDEKQKADIVQKAIQLSRQEGIYIQITLIRRRDDGSPSSIAYYVSGDNSYIRSFLPKEVKIPDNFSDSSFYFTTEKTNAPNALPVFSYYKKTSFLYAPMRLILDKDFILAEMEYFYTPSQKDIDARVLDTYSSYSAEYMDLGTHQFYKDEEIPSLFSFYAIIIFILCQLYIFFRISSGAKSVMVFKLQGYGTFSILSYLFKTEFFLGAASFLLVPCIGTWLIFRAWNPRMIELLLYGYLYLGLLLLVLILCGFAGAIFLNRQKISDLLKNKNFNEKITVCIFVLVVFVGCALLPKLETPLHNFPELFHAARYFQTHGEIAAKYREIELQLTENRSFEMGTQHESARNDSAYALHQKIYDELNQEGLILKFRENEYVDEKGREAYENSGVEPVYHRGYEINEAYFSLCEFFQKDTKIPLSALPSGTVYIFMPRDLQSQTKWEAFNFHLSGTAIQIVPYDRVKYADLAIDDPESSSTQPIFVLQKDEDHFLEESINFGLFVSQENTARVEREFDRYGVRESIGWRDGAERVKQGKQNLRDYTGYTLAEMFPVLCVFLITLSSLCYFYIASSKKKWAVYRSLGYPAHRVIYGFYWELAVIFMLIVSYCLLVIRSRPIMTWGFLFVILSATAPVIAIRYRRMDMSEVLG